MQKNSKLKKNVRNIERIKIPSSLVFLFAFLMAKADNLKANNTRVHETLILHISETTFLKSRYKSENPTYIHIYIYTSVILKML
jgi:hypothetical protein